MNNAPNYAPLLAISPGYDGEDEKFWFESIKFVTDPVIELNRTEVLHKLACFKECHPIFFDEDQCFDLWPTEMLNRYYYQCAESFERQQQLKFILTISLTTLEVRLMTEFGLQKFQWYALRAVSTQPTSIQMHMFLDVLKAEFRKAKGSNEALDL